MRVLIFLCLAVAGIGCSRFQKLKKSQDIDEKYNAAIGYFEKKDYFRAGELLEDVMPLLKGTDKEEKAQYYYGFCHFYERQYQLSAFYFKTFYEKYTRSEFAEEAAYMEGLSYFEDSPTYELDQENTMNAMRVVQTFLTVYPNSEHKEDCNFIVEKLRDKLIRKNFENARLYYHKENFQAAIIALDNFRKDYPESSLNEEAYAMRVSSAFLLAKASIPSKQPERYGQVVNLYESFLNTYPESKKLRSVENLYASAQEWLKNNRPGGVREEKALNDMAPIKTN